jgi:hypothetical protein
MGDTSVLCHDSLSFDQSYEIFGQLRDVVAGNVPTIKANSIPQNLQVGIYDEEGLKWRRDDNYGDELTFLSAKQLKGLHVPCDVSPKNKAIMAFVQALPDDTPIILFWR